MFDPQKDITELLLISHIYWELSRIYEMTPKLQKSYHKTLAQFVKFTVNQPYQVLNAEMLRKYIKKNKNKSVQIKALNEAYQQIFVQSAKCYIATMCFGNSHPHTQTLREFKSLLLTLPYGIELIRLYYLYSSRLVQLSQKSKVVHHVSLNIFRPFLTVLAKFLDISIVK